MSDLDHARFLRQILVDGIGEAGQRLVSRASAPVSGSSAAHDVAALYARRAGFAELAPGPASFDELAPEWVMAPDARDVLAGARAATRAIVCAVTVTEP